ncbi:MAG: hypothetical protein WCA30_00185 [Dermatophilaceae bacterium]
MRSTLTRSIAAVGLGVALTLAPVGVALAADPTVPNPIDEPFVDTSIGDDNEYNQEANWEFWLTELGFEGVSCQKTDYEGEGPAVYEVPEYDSEDAPWLLAIVKAGADPSTDGMTNDLYWEPAPGEELEHNSGKSISHVIICSAYVETETTPPTTPVTSTTTSTTTTSTTTTGTSTTTTGTMTTTTPVTGPVVETDRPAGGDMGQVGLFAGAAVFLAAATALLLGRRRQSAEH